MRLSSILLAVLVVRADAAGLPEILPGQWHEIPHSSLVASGLPGTTGGAVHNITAWSGAALDSETNRLYVWGGGHADYAGNEVFGSTWRPCAGRA